MNKFYEELIKIVGENFYFTNANLKPFNTYRVQAISKHLVIVKDEKKLIKILDLCKKYNKKFLLLGNGSNILFVDSVYKKLIIILRGESVKFSKECDTEVIAFSGVRINKLIEECAYKNLGGLEMLSGVPATIGGACIMNASSFDNSFSSCVKAVKVYCNGKVKWLNKGKCNFNYRSSVFKNSSMIILSVKFEMIKRSYDIVQNNKKNYMLRKKESQPLDCFSAGSVFKNGYNYYSAKLIETLGLKGYEYNGAKISTKHSNFIINENNAKGKDIYKLIKKIEKIIFLSYNINLEREIIIIKK